MASLRLRFLICVELGLEMALRVCAGELEVLRSRLLQAALCLIEIKLRDLPRRLYDETLSGSRGFWILVVPGVIHNRQPRFNEGPAMWHLEGATLPLLNPLPGPSHA